MYGVTEDTYRFLRVTVDPEQKKRNVSKDNISMAKTRRRGAELETAILAAVLTELGERGYAGVTYEGVAARAATSKPVLYRRWATRAELVMAAIIASTTPAIAVPDTGSLVKDLETLLGSMRDNFGSTGRATMLGMLSELDHDAAASLRDVIFAWGADLIEPLVDRARHRGELGGQEIPTAVLALPLDLARHELAIRGAMPSERIETIVETIAVPLLTLHSRAGIDQTPRQRG